MVVDCDGKPGATRLFFFLNQGDPRNHTKSPKTLKLCVISWIVLIVTPIPVALEHRRLGGSGEKYPKRHAIIRFQAKPFNGE